MELARHHLCVGEPVRALRIQPVQMAPDMLDKAGLHTDPAANGNEGSIVMPHKQKVSAEEKMRIVREYLSGKISHLEAEQQAEVVSIVIDDWCRLYRREGANAFLPQKHHVYSAETKKDAVEEYLAGTGSLQYLSEKYGLRSYTQLQSWIKVYNAHGDFNSIKFSGGGSYMRQGRETTLEERIQIVKECIAGGKNYGEMALKHQVSYQQVRTWTLRFEEMGGAGLQDRRGRRKKDQAPRTELEKA